MREIRDVNAELTVTAGTGLTGSVIGATEISDWSVLKDEVFQTL